jgi:acetylserotonin N-methyltransferase
VCRAAGLVACDAAGAHHLTPDGAQAFADDSPVAYGAYLDLLREAAAMTSVEAVRDAIRTDRPQTHRLASGGPRTSLLTEAMHDRGRLAASTWPSLVDLGGARTLLDLGGGSGVHAHAALRRWPELRAVVLDRPEVCELAEAAAGAAGLADRVRVVPGDYEDLATPLPEADVHLWSEVLHNRDAATCRALLGRSHAELDPGGQVLVHEMPLDDDGGPLAVAAASVNMLLWTRSGRQHRRGELLAWLAAAGFDDVGHRPVVGHFELFTGRKAR